MVTTQNIITEAEKWLRGEPVPSGFDFRVGDYGARYLCPITGMDPGDAWMVRCEFTSQFAFAIPSAECLSLIAKHGPITEVGAGTGFWAALLDRRGVDIVATDGASPGVTCYNQNLGKWFPVSTVTGPEAVASGRTVLMCWPPDASWPVEVLRAMQHGQKLIHIGEGWGGCCGNEEFHEFLIDNFEEIDEDAYLPQFFGIRDSLTLYRRKT